MQDPVDDIVFSKRLKTYDGSITLFDRTSQYIRIPPPDLNSSISTGKDLLTTQGATYLLTDRMKKSIKKHDKDPVYALKIYMDLFGLDYSLKFIDKVLKESSVLIGNQKNKFNRARPSQLAPYFGVDLSVLSSRTNKNPSYPSGHSAQSRLIAEIYAEKYPIHKDNLLKAAEECGFGRVMAGYHFPSDHKYGAYLGKRLFKTLKGNKKLKLINYNKVFDLKQRNRS